MAKILVVDDDPQLLRMVSLILERGGHEPLLEENPLNALEHIRRERPDLAVVDVMMPELGGHELIAQIRAADDVSDVAILVLSARAQSVDRQAALASGADAYLSKPVVPATLMEAIDRLLGDELPSTNGAGPEGMVISVFGLRGGVGRTTIAANLGAALRRENNEEVCLVDLTPSGGQAVVHLRLKTRVAWNDLPPVERLDWPTLKENLLMHQSGLRVLAAPRRPQLATMPSADLVTSVLAILRRAVSFVILDLPPILNPAVRVALTHTDVMLHVVTPDVVSVQLARHAAHYLARSERQPQEKIYILNQVTPEGQLTPTAVESGLRAQLAFQIGYDDRQARALMQGAPLSLTHANSPLPQVTRRLGEALAHRASNT